MTDQWRPVVGFPNYAVNLQGEVRGPKGGVLKPYLSRYSQVTIYKNRAPKLAHVHRLVCEAFHGPCPSALHEVAHCDGDAHNNSADNLRWATKVENEADKIAHGTSLTGKPSHVPAENQARGQTHGRKTKPWRTARGERGGRAKLTEQNVRSIRTDLRPRKLLAAEHGVSVALIGMIQTGKVWTHVQ